MSGMASIFGSARRLWVLFRFIAQRNELQVATKVLVQASIIGGVFEAFLLLSTIVNSRIWNLKTLS